MGGGRRRRRELSRGGKRDERGEGEGEEEELWV